MKDFFEADSPLLGEKVERFTWVGSKIPELIFLYEIRKSYDEGALLTPESLLQLADRFEVDIWPLKIWAKRGNSIEHRDLFNLYNQAEHLVDLREIRRIISDNPSLKISENEINALRIGESETFIFKLLKQLEDERKEKEARVLREYAEQRAKAQAAKSPEQIIYESSVTNILDISQTLKSSIESENDSQSNIIKARAIEFLKAAPVSLRNSSIYLNLEALIAQVN